MVFVKDFRKDFYDKIINKRVLVLVSLDIDAICACKILQYLFQCDHVLYTIVPVIGVSDFEKAYMENSEGIQYVVLINCGGCLDIIELLQPENETIFFIADSHRPVHIHNIYNQVQVHLLMRQDEFDDVPVFDDLFRDDSGDEESDDGSDSEQSSKRKRFDENSMEKRRQKRLWEEKRQKVLFEYAEFSGYGTSSSLQLYEMAWKMSKDTNDLLWLAILGVTEQFIHNKSDRDRYIENIGDLQGHVSRLNHRPDDEENAVSIDCLKITFEQELQLTLFRHWSIYESLCHTSAVACNFKIFQLKGRKRLHEYLADMGLPLVQCKQRYNSMDVQFKESFKGLIQEHLAKYGLAERDLFLPSFNAQFGYRFKYTATDCIFSCESILEGVDREQSSSDNFLQALDVLNRKHTETIEKSFESAKLQIQAIVNQVQAFLEMGQVISAGPFLYAFVQEGTTDSKFFTKSICLQRLAKFTLDAYVSMVPSKNRSKIQQLPLVLGSTLSLEQGTMLVVGIPPISESSCKNFFGKAFEQAAASTNSRIQHEFFDTNVIELKTEDKSKFFDALITLLQ